MLDTYDMINLGMASLVALGLLIGWKDLNARCLLSMVLALSLFNILIIGSIHELGEVRYFMDILLNCLLAVGIIVRKYITRPLNESMYKAYSFNLADGAVIGMCLLMCAVDVMVLLEGFIYSLYLIDICPFRTYLSVPLQFMFGSLLSLAAFRYAVNPTTTK